MSHDVTLANCKRPIAEGTITRFPSQTLIRTYFVAAEHSPSAAGQQRGAAKSMRRVSM
jgi:hypothetical protein